MLYVQTGSDDACWNLALEEYFATVKKPGEMVFFLWQTKPTLVMGKFQNTNVEISMDYVRAHGVKVVRRMSGGGTIYSDKGNWMFSFIDYDAPGEGIRFKAYMQPILDALRGLGVDAAFNGRNDIVIDGKKVSGNAQYRLKGTTVHHGTLLFDGDIEAMVASTTVDDEKILSKSIRSVRDRVTNIRDHLQLPMAARAFGEYLKGSVMGEGGRVYVLTEEDRAAIERLTWEKYESWDWTFGMNPRYSLERSARLPGGRVTFRMDVEQNVIRAAALNGDFFAGERADELAAALVGCPYDRDAVRRRLVDGRFEDVIYGVTIEQLVSTIVI